VIDDGRSSQADLPSARRESQGGEYRELGGGKAPGGTTDMAVPASDVLGPLLLVWLSRWLPQTD
jgi:hypothetical protein